MRVCNQNKGSERNGERRKEKIEKDTKIEQQSIAALIAHFFFSLGFPQLRVCSRLMHVFSIQSSECGCGCSLYLCLVYYDFLSVFLLIIIMLFRVDAGSQMICCLCAAGGAPANRGVRAQVKEENWIEFDELNLSLVSSSESFSHDCKHTAQIDTEPKWDGASDGWIERGKQQNEHWNMWNTDRQRRGKNAFHLFIYLFRVDKR